MPLRSIVAAVLLGLFVLPAEAEQLDVKYFVVKRTIWVPRIDPRGINESRIAMQRHGVNLAAIDTRLSFCILIFYADAPLDRPPLGQYAVRRKPVNSKEGKRRVEFTFNDKVLKSLVCIRSPRDGDVEPTREELNAMFWDYFELR